MTTRAPKEHKADITAVSFLVIDLFTRVAMLVLADFVIPSGFHVLIRVILAYVIMVVGSTTVSALVKTLAIRHYAKQIAEKETE